MATRLKTVEYWFPCYTSTVTDATDTNLTQITVYLPESGKTFRSVVTDVIMHDINTTLTGNIDRRQTSLQLGTAGYSAINCTTANQIATGGENFTFQHTCDFTSYFTTNWSGTSMTCDLRVLADNDVATPLGFNNVSARLIITYEYDDTSATQVKTIRIPLNAPTGALGTTKPAEISAIPQLTGSGSPYLPEASPTVRQIVSVVQGNTSGAAATDRTYTIQVDSLTSFTTGSYEHGSTPDLWVRFNSIESFDTTASHSWYLWSSLASLNHAQAWLVVTYEFTVSGTTSILNSLLMPFSWPGPMGGTTSSDYQRAAIDLWIEEPSTITTKHLAAYPFWTQVGTVAGLQLRIGTGSFVAYTETASTLVGGNGAMVRNDAAFTLARGKNTLTIDSYRTDTTDLGWTGGGFWIINYTSGSPSGGPGAANHSVLWYILTHGAGSSTAGHAIIAATAPVIPETSYYLNSVGVDYTTQTSITTNPWCEVHVERLSAEGGVMWEEVMRANNYNDPEPGIISQFGEGNQFRNLFKRYPNDPTSGSIDLETSRRWRHIPVNACYPSLALMLTYHTITFTVSGTVSGYSDADGAGLTVEIWRADGNKVAEATTTTGGSYTATVYDSSLAHWATCREDSTHVGRSDNVTPS